MNQTVFTLTLRQFFGQRRSLFLLLLAAVPVILAVIFRAGDHLDQHDWTANVLLDRMIITTVLPLACLILGTAALGSEIEDGTVVYILAKPIPRYQVIISKFAASAVVVLAFLVPAAAISSLIALEGVSAENIPAAFTIATLLGVIAYSAVFILFSVATSRALIAGLAYVFIWEGIVTDLFTATRWISIRQYCLGIADLLSTVHPDDFEAELNGVAAIILITTATALALLIATRRLQHLELTETD
jgi:ABC-2 type transport system permease protein